MGKLLSTRKARSRLLGLIPLTLILAIMAINVWAVDVWVRHDGKWDLMYVFKREYPAGLEWPAAIFLTEGYVLMIGTICFLGWLAYTLGNSLERWQKAGR